MEAADQVLLEIHSLREEGSFSAKNIEENK